MKFIIHAETGKVLTHYVAFGGSPEPHQVFIDSDNIQVIEEQDEEGNTVVRYEPEFYEV